MFRSISIVIVAVIMATLAAPGQAPGEQSQTPAAAVPAVAAPTTPSAAPVGAGLEIAVKPDPGIKPEEMISVGCSQCSAVEIDYEPLTASGLEELTAVKCVTLKEAQKIALDNNIDLANARRDLRSAELDIVRVKANYDPYVRADASYSNSNRPSSTSQLLGRSSESLSMNMSSGANTITGGNVSVNFNNSRSESDSVFSSLNPSYNTDLNMSLSQPLLKNRYEDVRAMDIEQRENDFGRSRLALESKIHEIEAQVEDAYWSLARSRMDLDLKRQSLCLSQRMLTITQTQVTAGQAAAVSTIQSEANVASAESTLIRSENDYRKGQFTFKVTLNLEPEDLWSLELVPADQPKYATVCLNRRDLVNEVVAANFGLRQSKLSLQNTEIGNEQAKNRTLPQLDLRASVGVSGLAGTDNPQDQVVETGFVVPNPYPPNQFPQPYMVERVVVPGQASAYAGEYIDALENMLSQDNLSWSAGVTFQVPLGNRAAESDYKKTILNYEKQLTDLRDQQRQVLINLVNLIYDLEAAHRSLIAANRARDLQEQNLKTEEKKYTLGLNTSYEVFQAEQSFNEARSQEINALVDYTKTIGRLERARLGYLTGGPGVSPSLSNLTSSVSVPAGLDASALSSYASMLPAGIDINQLRSMLP